ncbi:MAG: Trm112 family protein [Actinomycetota bacterium]
MPLDPFLVGLLACPLDKEPLHYFEADELLYNPRLKKSFRVEGTIPVLLPSEATDVDDATAKRLDEAIAKGKGVVTGASVSHSPSSH